MTQQTSPNRYKQEITAFYQDRTNYNNDFTYRRAIPLVKLAHLQPGQQILDVATGTGIIAIAAAQIVGIEIKTEQFGNYLSLDEAKNFWKGTWLCPNGHPLLNLPAEQIEQLKAEFRTEVEKLVTDKGVWLEKITFFVMGKK